VRPEVVALVALVFVVSLVGFTAHRSIYFQISEAGSGLAVHPCIFEHKSKIGGDIQDWDMSALSKDKTSCTTKHCRDHSVTRGDEVFFLNVCRNTMNRPDECIGVYGAKKRVPKAIGYQTADGVCYKTGDVKTAKWSLLDPKDPKKGVKLKYTGGARCDGYTERSTEYRFECDPMAGYGEPLAVYGDCEFVVRWRTALACPIHPSVFLPILFWVGFVIGLYLTIRFFHNILVTKMLLGWEAVPHIQEIRYMGALILMISEKLWEALSKVAPGAATKIGAWWERVVGGRLKSAGGYTSTEDAHVGGRDR